MLRSTFDQVAVLYDRARPGYPAQLFDDLAVLANLPDGARVLEIGCGTGQATVPLAERGYAVTAVELGEQLAALARAKLARFAEVEVITADFETWHPTRGGFDAAVSFTASHWIAPELRYAKPAALLRDGGMLGVVSTEHVLEADGDDFFIDVQEDYQAVLPDEPASNAGGPQPPDAIPDLSDEIAASGRFRNIAARRYVWDVVYTADAFIDVHNTYSNHRGLDSETRERLHARIRQRVNGRPNGQVRKTYLAMLNVAERL